MHSACKNLLSNGEEAENQCPNMFAIFKAFWLNFSPRRLLKHSVGWLVGCFGLNGPLRQYFSPYRAVSQREGERKEK